MSHLNFMWCLLMNFPQSHSLGKVQYPQILQILCNAAHKEVHQRILTSKILGSLQILKDIPEKLQLTFQESHQKIIQILSHRCSLYNKYKKVRSSRDNKSLKLSNVQFLRELATHQIYQKFI